MKRSTSIHLQFTREAASFIALVVIFLFCIFGIFEVTASQPWFLNIISYPSPSINSSFPELDVKIQRLWEYGSPNCLIIGSSMADTGLNPSLLEDLVNKKYNTEYRCFNMGFSSSMLEVSSAVANSMISWNNIDLIIWGISPIDMDPNFTKTRAIVEMPVFAQNNKNYSLVGFLFNHSRFPWFLATLLHQQDEEYSKDLATYNNVLDSRGMRRSTQGKVIDAGKILLPDFSIYPEDLKAFEMFLKNFKGQGKKIIIVEMPVNPDFYPYLIGGGDENYKEKFIIPIENIVTIKNIPFIQTQEKISTIVAKDTDWGNETHLNTMGADKFTRYIVGISEDEGILP
jgi:hypothetical protein